MAARSVMLCVFRRVAPNRCSKTMNWMILAAVAVPSAASGARSLSAPPWRFWEGPTRDGCQLPIDRRPDDAVAARVVAMWERLYVARFDSGLLLSPCEAQVTLAVYPDDVPTDRIDDALDRLDGSWEAMPVNITDIGIFGGLSPVLSLAVAPTAGLLAWQRDTRWRPGCWTPATVVSQHASSVADGIRLLLPMLQEPVGGELVAVELVELASGTIISSWSLQRG